MPDVPANFFHRTDLQATILKANGLLADTPCPTQKAALVKLMCAAAELEGVLADIPPSTHPNCKALANPNGWTSRWLDSTLESGPFKIDYSQQVLDMTVGGKSQYLATGRFRLKLGAETHTSSDTKKLRALLVRHLHTFPGVTSGERSFVLDHLFSEGADAVQEQGAAAVDVRNPA